MSDTKKHLTHLESVGLIRLAQTHPELEFMFRHALIRDAAYKSLLREDRIKLHQQVAEAIEQTYPDQLDEYAASLAQHYTAAGLNEQALRYWQQAGDYAKQRSANAEAIEHLSNGLKLLETLPDTPERASQELALQIGLGSVVMATQGFGAPEVEKAYTRARELCRQIGETPQLFPVLYGLWVFHLVRAQYQTTRELAEEMLQLAQGQPDSSPLLRAYASLGYVLIVIGKAALARMHLEQGLALYDPQQYQTPALLYGHDPVAVGLSYLAEALWLLGYPDQAVQRSREALIVAQEISHPSSLAQTLSRSIFLYLYRREQGTVQELTTAYITLSSEQGFQFHLVVGTIFQGWLLAEQGRFDEGLAEIRQAEDKVLAMEVEQNQPYALALLAETLEKAGRVEEGLATLTEALAITEKTDERMWEAELYRLKGELLLKQGADESEVEPSFQKAIEVAQHQQAKSLELRATVSLGRLWQSQGRQDEARQMLAEIYGWFTEGFDTLDLQEAKALLEELG